MNSTEKRDYLLKTLSRTNRKNYENYVVNRIWNKLDNLEIKPVSQQYVKRDDCKYALLDLYFPQINLGIECDEVYHKENTIPDKIREAKVEDALNALNIGSDFKLVRIDADTDIENFNRQIDEAVITIKSEYEKAGSPKWSDELSPVEKVLEKEYISVTDPYYFRTIAEIGRIFGKNYKQKQQCTFMANREDMVWCPKLAIVENGKRKSASKFGWINWLSQDWEEIFEEIPDKSRYGKPPIQIKRIVFAKSKNSLGNNVYKFIGYYCFDRQIENNSINVYKLISRRYDVPSLNTFAEKWLNHCKTAKNILENTMFAEKCISMNIEMDAGNSLRTYAEEKGLCGDIFSLDFMKENARKIDNERILVNGIFSMYRYVTHWRYMQEYFTEDDRQWFILAFEQLKRITKQSKNS